MCRHTASIKDFDRLISLLGVKLSDWSLDADSIISRYYTEPMLTQHSTYYTISYGTNSNENGTEQQPCQHHSQVCCRELYSNRNLLDKQLSTILSFQLYIHCLQQFWMLTFLPTPFQSIKLPFHLSTTQNVGNLQVRFLRAVSWTKLHSHVPRFNKELQFRQQILME